MKPHNLYLDFFGQFLSGKLTPWLRAANFTRLTYLKNVFVFLWLNILYYTIAKNYYIKKYKGFFGQKYFFMFATVTSKETFGLVRRNCDRFMNPRAGKGTGEPLAPLAVKNVRSRRWKIARELRNGKKRPGQGGTGKKMHDRTSVS